MLTVNIPHVLFFYEHATLFLLELLFQGYHQYAEFRGSISFVHASFVEQKLVFWSNMQVFGSTCDSHGSNQYQAACVRFCVTNLSATFPDVTLHVVLRCNKTSSDSTSKLPAKFYPELQKDCFCPVSGVSTEKCLNKLSG